MSAGGQAPPRTKHQASGAEHGVDVMLRVALTGGIATGKSSVLRTLASFGCRTIDADILAREAVLRDSPGWRAVVERFGREILQSDGTIDRARLGRIVFQDPAARRGLEAIVHPRVYQAIERRFQNAATRDPHAIVVADIPLLIETGGQTGFDRVVLVTCDPEQQLQRVMERDGLSREEAAKRIAAQLPLEEKRAHADYIVDTSGSFEETTRQVEAVYRELCAANRRRT